MILNLYLKNLGSIRNVGKYTVTGNEKWTYRSEYTENDIYFYSITSVSWILNNINYKYYSNTKALNNYLDYSQTFVGPYNFKVSNSNFTLYYNTSQPNTRAIYLKSSISTETDFKSNLQSLYNSGKPMIIYYELAEPQFESITLPQVNLYWNSDTFVTDGYVTKTYN